MSAPTTPELPKPDLWRDASGFRGYTKDPGPGPWYSAESMRAALVAPASPWLPISSAPKHTEVLVWREDSGPFIAQLSTPEGVFATDVLEKMGDSFGDDFEEWYSEAYGWQEGSEKPTHWQALPGGPVEQGEQG